MVVSRQQLQDYVGRTVPGWAVTPASDYAKDRGASLDEAAALARRFNASFEASAVRLAITPGQLVHSDRLAREIRPEIEATRRALFKRGSAPFRSHEAAARWILRLHRDARLPNTRERDRAERLLREGEVRVRKAAALLHRTPVNIAPVDAALPFVHGGVIDHVPAPPDTPLGALQKAVATLADRTGFGAHSLVAYILVGVEPILPMVRVREQRDFGSALPPRTRVTLELFARDVTFAQLHTLYRRLRRQLGVTRKKSLSDRHHRLAKLVEALGGEPPPGRRGRAPADRSPGQTRLAFWEQVLREWNRRYPKQPYRTWRGLERLYRRLQAHEMA